MPRRAGKQGRKKNGSLPGCEAEKPLIPEAEEFQIQGSWAPVTPVKPIPPKQPPICADKQTRANWFFPQSFSQETQIQGLPACCELRNSIDNNENFSNVPFASLIALADAAAVTRPPANGTQHGSSSFNYTINSQSATSSLANQSISFGFDSWNSSTSALETYFYGNTISFQPAYDLNSQHRGLPETVSYVNIPSQFAPVTPDNSKKAKNKKACDLQNPNVDERTIQAQDKQSNNIAPRVEVEELQHDKEQLHLPKDLSCVEVSTQLQENHNPDKGGDPGIDLNKTQQKRRRKKYMPKVVVEGKPKRTPKPATPKPTNSKEKPTGKRKYVRKNKVEKSPSTPGVEEMSSGAEPKQGPPPAAPSCRRKLNYDSENQVRKESSSCRPQSNIDAESQAQNFCTRVESQLTVQLGQGIEARVEKTGMGIAYDLTQSMNKVLEDYISMPERQAPGPQTPAKTDQLHKKLKAHVEDKCRRGRCRITFSEQTHDKQGSPLQKMMKTDVQSGPRSPGDSNCSSSTCLTEEQAKGLKRGYSCRPDEVQHISTNAVGCHYSSLHEYLTNIPEDLYKNGVMGMCFPAPYKKKRAEKRHNSTTLSTLPSMAPTENSVQQGMAPSLNNNCSAPYAPDINCRFSVNQFNTSCIEAQEKQQMLDCEQALSKKRTTRKRSKNPTQVQNLASLVGIVHYGQLPNCPAEGAPKHNDMQGYEISHYPKTCMEALSADTHAMRTKKRTKRNSSGDSVTTGAIQKRIFPVDEIVEQIKSLSINSESKTPKNQTPNSLIPCGLRYEEQNAIVLYQRDGTIIPFEGSFNPSWRRRPRPKVDLDDETTRVWKLLLENINSEGIDGTDEEKAKWWQEERRVFRGRADSFIARMHLVQGDRRFSPWKGSVVDSVIGVFLTQNVSDHLSSSAFMSLAAQFPLKPDTNSMTCSEETNTLAKEPEVSILDPEDVIKWHEDKLNQPACDSSSMTLHDMDYNVEKEVVNSNELLQCSSGTETSSDNLKCRLSDIPGNGLTKPNFMSEKRENDVLSSQCSAGSSQNTLESSKKQTAERKGLQQEYLEADLKARSSDLVGASFLELLQRAETFHGLNENGHNFREGTECGTQKQNKEVSESSKASPRPIAPSPNYHLHMISNSRELEIESIEMVGEESLSSNHYRKNEENCTSEQSGVTAESVSQSVVQKNLVVSLKEAPNSASENNQSCSSCQEEENKFIGIQNRPDGDPKDCVESQTQGHNCIMQHALDMPTLSRETLDATDSTSVIDCTRNIGHKEVVSGLKDHGCLPGKVNNKLSSNSSKVKRGSTGRQKQKTVDWDSLRLQAQANGRKREQTANTMDSLDWEAVRCADVNDIADTIKARGMNNMLAERIKAFLNRLVREHGSIDLEWLRDVPPDKAKEYLLSIRGLGLKSVECVRLLTLHHLAFPVDTNVGRIAVRLGWVPLQPLPESLQLHLLELYPVLESIQKYLWPRLCKLDQRTLYELHYQMITFGKVFCTKSKPNCNACPMRGECRHFASAFASARLALPGPEERSIVSATEDKAASQNPVQAMKPLQSLPQASQQLQMQSQINRCEPIVEEPATPEPIIEVPATPELEPVVPEHDIEDAFCEDPEEIPTIKLNIDVFTQNLQNYMQQNMELQEGDMCKALVALNPEAASIPAPKLKNVSRLRTEHQVYELPDSHPLLEGLDKREPDDPCSYLLAIWAPGETASSIQLPERKCSSQEFGKLCDDKTCFSCNSIREADSQTVRGTLLIPCRTAMRGSFPLNGTYFQVNEVFADHESSINPIDVPRSWIWNLPRRTVYFGTSIPTIFKGLSTESIQYCFWRGFVCVRGFDQKTRAPRPLMARLHFPASKLTRTRGNNDERLE